MRHVISFGVIHVWRALGCVAGTIQPQLFVVQGVSIHSWIHRRKRHGIDDVCRGGGDSS